MSTIRISYEAKRGCGYRKAGGIYLVTEGSGRFCGALPIELSVCPACHQGIHPARGWTWIDLQKIRNNKPCVQSKGPDYCNSCPFFSITEAGLIWVGEKYYKNPAEFSLEADAMGISRRISQLPKRFKLGETWVALAHKKVIRVLDESTVRPDALPGELDVSYKPGIFHIFKPSAIEYVVKEDDSEEKLERLEKRGFTLVKVVPKEQQQQEAA